METRPKIRIELSKLDRTLEFSGVILLFLMWGLTLYTFLKLPATIPIHYNAVGKVDNYGDKTSLLFLPVLVTVIYFSLSYLNKYPHIFNYMTKITPDNAEQQYSISTRMLRVLKLLILIVFTLIILFTYLTAVGITNGLEAWFLPVTFGFFVILAILSVTKTLKAK